MVSRVMSSLVGPRPPVVITRSDLFQQSEKRVLYHRLDRELPGWRPHRARGGQAACQDKLSGHFLGYRVKVHLRVMVSTRIDAVIKKVRVVLGE